MADISLAGGWSFCMRGSLLSFKLGLKCRTPSASLLRAARFFSTLLFQYFFIHFNTFQYVQYSWDWIFSLISKYFLQIYFILLWYLCFTWFPLTLQRCVAAQQDCVEHVLTYWKHTAENDKDFLFLEKNLKKKNILETHCGKKAYMCTTVLHIERYKENDSIIIVPTLTGAAKVKVVRVWMGPTSHFR